MSQVGQARADLMHEAGEWLHLDEARVSVSLVTIELTPANAQTRLLYTEQAVYLDGGDTPTSREHGTRELLDKLALSLST